jgi:hypothetical protein
MEFVQYGPAAMRGVKIDALADVADCEDSR